MGRVFSGETGIGEREKVGCCVKFIDAYCYDNVELPARIRDWKRPEGFVVEVMLH